MKTLIVLLSLVFAFAFTPETKITAREKIAEVQNPAEKTTIQVAILLDASNSMDGLIDQAKSRLWNIVNTLTTLKYNGVTPDIEIALYMYGNDGLNPEENYIKQVSPFTGSLDVISEKLFSITTNGGSEYCGAVIEDAVKKLDWGNEDSDMKLIYIAGNEEFDQGGVSYKEAISSALKKDIYINTIHCGDYHEGVNGFWKDGADKGQGKYFCINSDEAIAFIATPYDDDINSYNEKLNKTYMYYGSQGQYNYTNQAAQDYNSESISQSNKTERVVSKSKAVYNNYNWDLVDMNKQDPDYLKNVDKKTLSEEYQDMSTSELELEVTKMTKEREGIQQNISVLSVKRQEYIDNEMAKSDKQDDFGNAINESILEFAEIKGYEVE